ncbi:hypothetical protein Gotri_005925 [Gossypium trilobum]|uniref:Uncharacterized protein n=1 Tax=Gossypium trilobum TaxID=34281 RepID=A0A7J9EY98_9ROSI|nr:hypothetical protein [Gossypium trilobum]
MLDGPNYWDTKSLAEPLRPACSMSARRFSLSGVTRGLGWTEIVALWGPVADQSGTIVEILAEDGKAVSVDMVSILDFLDSK